VANTAVAAPAAPKVNTEAIIDAANATPNPIYVPIATALVSFTLHASLYYSAEGNILLDIINSKFFFLVSSVILEYTLLATFSHVVSFIKPSDITLCTVKL